MSCEIDSVWGFVDGENLYLFKILSKDRGKWIKGFNNCEQAYKEKVLTKNFTRVPKELENEPEEVIRFYLEL